VLKMSGQAPGSDYVLQMDFSPQVENPTNQQNNIGANNALYLGMLVNQHGLTTWANAVTENVANTVYTTTTDPYTGIVSLQAENLPAVGPYAYNPSQTEGQVTQLSSQPFQGSFQQFLNSTYEQTVGSTTHTHYFYELSLDELRGTWGVDLSTDTTWAVLDVGQSIFSVVAGPASWQATGNASWVNPAAWSTGIVPNAVGQAVLVGGTTNKTVTITLDGPQTLGALTFTNSGTSPGGYALAAGAAGTLTLASSSAPAQIVVGAGTFGIAASVNLASNAEVSISSGGSLAVSGNIADNGGNHSLSLDGGGTLILSGSDSFQGGTTVTAGTLILDSPEALASGSNLTVGDASAFAGGPGGAGADAAGSTAAGIELLAASPGIVPVPEPATLALLAAGAALLAIYRKGRRQQPSDRA